MKEQVSQELLEANRTAQEYINGRLPSVYSLNYDSTGEAIEGAVSGYSLELVDASTVKNLATSDKTLLPYKYVDGKKDVRWNTAKVNAEVLQGIVQGESIPKIAKRLQNVTEMNRASAIRNARTTVTSAENKGRMDSLHRAAEKGVITRKVWMAAIDARTREAHRLLDGQEQEIDDPFKSIDGDIMFPGDPDARPEMVYNCRCTLTYKVVGFGDRTVTEEVESETTEEFIPATSIAEAEEYAKQFVGYGGSVSYKGIGTEYANTCNRVLTEVNERFDVGKINSIQPMNMRQNLWKDSTSEAAYRWGNGDLFINPKYYKNASAFSAHKQEIDGLMRTVLDGGQTLIDSGRVTGRKKDYIESLLRTGRQCVAQSHDFVEGTFVHECGHMLDDKIFRSGLKETLGGGSSTYQEILAESRLRYGGGISGYAVSDNQEYLAETFTAWWYGESDKCDPIIIQVIEGLVKK
jgi:SPP1 gp7 family putative phage head morphogenesis protein